MSGCSPSDPDTVTLPFVFIPDGEPMPEAVRHFRDPIILRARFEPASQSGEPTDGQASHKAHPEMVQAPGPIAEHIVRRGVADRYSGAYDLAENGPPSTPPPLPPGLSQEQQTRLSSVARNWSSARVPYAPSNSPMAGINASLAGADCSGAVYAIYNQAGISIPYSATEGFPRHPSFTPLPSGSTPQVGDVLWWPGHVAIFAGEVPESGHKMWTAFRPQGPDFGLSLSIYRWGTAPPGTAPVIYRYNGR